MPAVAKIPTEDTPAELAPIKIECHKLLCQVDVMLRQIALQDRRYDALLHMPVERVRQLTEPIRYGYECKVVRHRGRTYHFADGQAEVVRILRRQQAKAVKRVHEKTILMILGDEYADGDYRLLDRFRNGKVYHPSIGPMILHEDGWWCIVAD